jgi:hypothetical protein
MGRYDDYHDAAPPQVIQTFDQATALPVFFHALGAAALAVLQS